MHTICSPHTTAPTRGRQPRTVTDLGPCGRRREVGGADEGTLDLPPRQSGASPGGERDVTSHASPGGERDVTSHASLVRGKRDRGTRWSGYREGPEGVLALPLFRPSSPFSPSPSLFPSPPLLLPRHHPPYKGTVLRERPGLHSPARRRPGRRRRRGGCTRRWAFSPEPPVAIRYGRASCCKCAGSCSRAWRLLGVLNV